MNASSRCQVGEWRFAIAAAELDKHAKLVALAFSIYMDSHGFCFVSLAKLVEVTGMGKATVSKYTQLLVESGFLRRTTEGRGKRSYTTATLPEWVVEIPQSGSARVNHPPAERSSVSSGTGSISEQTGSAGVNPNSITPREELQPEACKHTKRIRTGPAGAWSICGECGHTSIEEKGTRVLPDPYAEAEANFRAAAFEDEEV